MPVLWRYFLRNYLQIFLLSICAFIAILFVMRIKEIVEFATLASNGFSIFLFSLYQIPHILPETVPISCAIASILLFQKASRSQEITSLRASGLNLKTLLFPVLFIGGVLSLLNFCIAAELSPYAKNATKNLKQNMMSANPFFIFNKISEGRLKNAYVDMHTFNKEGKNARDTLLILNNSHNGRLGIIAAKELILQDDLFIGKDVSIISSVDSKTKTNFDHLVIENQSLMETKASTLYDLLHDKEWRIQSECLPFRLLLAKVLLQKKSIFLQSTGLEIAKRISIGLAPFVFTLMGSAFGLEVGRANSKKKILKIVLLTVLYLAFFIAAKSFKHFPPLGWVIYFLPFPLMVGLSLLSLKKFAQGIE